MPFRPALIVAGFICFAFASASASYLQIVGPINATLVNNGTVYLGKVAPGQSFYILASANTTNKTGTFVNLGWSALSQVKLPTGWSFQSSKLYENPMKARIAVSSDAKNGTYEIVFRAVNVGNYSRLGNLTVYAFVNVTPQVFSLNVTPTKIDAGLGQPSNIYVTINNTGISDDPFYIMAIGLPAWNVTDQVISRHGTKNTFIYPVFLNEPGVYHFNLTVGSTTSTLVSKTYPVDFTVKESLLNDYQAIGNGVVLSPLIFEPAYAFMSLLDWLYKSVVG